MPITEFLIRNAKLYGDDICLTEINPELDEKNRQKLKAYGLDDTVGVGGSRKVMTWREFNEQANRFANLLLARGVGRGHKVGILLMNCIEWLPVYFGALKSGALAVPLNYRYTSDELKYCLGLADVSTLVFGPEFIGRVQAVKEDNSRLESFLFLGGDCPRFAESCEELTSACSPREPGVHLLDEDEAAIYFSSAVTGFPKAVLHTHQSLVTACVVERYHHGQTRDDVFLCIPPLYHAGAKMHWFGSLISGSGAVLLRGTRPRWILEAAANERATIVWLLVPWAQDILDAVESGEIDLDDYDLRDWRLMHIGAQPVPPGLVHRWKRHFPEHEYDANYGLSESIGPGAVHLGVENTHKAGAIGKAGLGWDTKIADESGAEVERGRIGELAVRGGGVMKQYYKDPEATAAALRDGWLYTGDMAREDDEGFIFLEGRKKDVIITGGENICPVQIEGFLRGHEKIADVAVIGLGDRRLGEIAAAVIEIKPGMECCEEEIILFCNQLPRYKRPRRIIFDTVPRDPAGNIDKAGLREKYHGGDTVTEQTGSDIALVETVAVQAW